MTSISVRWPMRTRSRRAAAGAVRPRYPRRASPESFVERVSTRHAMTSLAEDDEIRVLYLTGGRRLGGMEHHLIALASRLPPSVRCLVCCLDASADYEARLDGRSNRAYQPGLANPPATRRQRSRISGSNAPSDAFDRTSCIRTGSSPMSSRVCCARGVRMSASLPAGVGRMRTGAIRPSGVSSIGCRTKSCAFHRRPRRSSSRRNLRGPAC